MCRALFRSLCLATIGVVPARSLAEDAATPLPAVRGEAQRALGEAISRSETDSRRPVDLAIDPARALATIPGLLASDRRNEAQDLRLSVRGFGARSAFGVRGLRIVVDGIPASMPDGQAQLSHIPWQADAEISVERGPFAALAGAGGALIEVRTLGELRDGWRGELVVADAGRRRLGLGGSFANTAALDCPGCGLGVDLLAHDNAGFRPQSAASRQQFAARWQLPAATGRWDLRLHALRSRADDPLGLDRATLDSEPDSTAPAALLFDTRKSVDHTELALGWAADDGRWRTTVHLGQRRLWQYLAVPPAVQRPASHPGGVIALDRHFGGLELAGGDDLSSDERGWRWRLAHERQGERRRGFENFVGPQLGLRGALRRDERNTADSTDAVIEAWQQRGDWLWRAGLRASRLRAAAEDRYIVDGNGDDSGQASDSALLPVIGLAWQTSERSQWQLSAGAGLEPPTLAERAYTPGGGGFNPTLQPSRHQQIELSWRWQGEAWQVAASLYALRSRDELAVVESSGGRTVFDNLGDGHRRGAELAASGPAGPWTWRLAATWLDARLRDAGVDSALPGVPRQWLGAQIQRPLGEGQRFGVDLFAAGPIPVDLGNRDPAPGHGRIDLWWEQQRLFGSPLTLGLRLDNVLDRRHAASVIVAERNGRYYEPAAGREWGLSLGWNW